MSDTATRPTPPPYPPDGSSQPPFGAPQPAYGPAEPTPPPARSRRAIFATVVIVTALVAGGAGGYVGAELWSRTQPNQVITPQAGNAPVVDDSEPLRRGSVERVAASVQPSVVQIEVSGAQSQGSGSGIVLSEDGVILTNNHVVEVAGDGGTLQVSFSDGSETEAEILGTDPVTDTAVIQAQNVAGLRPATIGQSSELRVGQQVVAIGSPFGLDSTVTSGIVSALDRPVNVGANSEGTATVYPAIQTDAAINPGNSGGPLVNMNGAVVGINSSIFSPSSGFGGEAGSVGLGFAIPIDEAMPISDQLRAGDEPTHAKMGVSLADGGSSVLGGVDEGSAADDAGLRAGDEIVEIDRKQIVSAESLIATIRSYRPGDEVAVTWLRDGDRQSATVTLDSDAE